MKCEVIRDLLPLYAEKLTSPESDALVEAHLQSCADCRRVLEEMQQSEPLPAAEERNIQPLRKIRRTGWMKAIWGFAGGIVLLTGLFYVLFVGVIPAKQSDVNIGITAKRAEDGMMLVEFDFTGNPAFALHRRTAYPEQGAEVTVYQTLRSPVEDAETIQNGFLQGWSKAEFTDDDTLIVHFRDGDVVYHLKDIAEEAGLQ